MNKNAFRKLAFANGLSPHYSGKQQTMFVYGTAAAVESLKQQTASLKLSFKVVHDFE